MLTIKKIKYLGKKVEWSFQNSSTSGGSEWSKDEPLPSFKNALQDLAVVEARLPLSPALYDELKVKGVSLKESQGEYIKASISFTADIPDQAAFNFVYHFDLLSEDNADLSAAVDVLVKETKRYINGERAQGDMFVENGDPQEPGREPEPEPETAEANQESVEG